MIREFLLKFRIKDLAKGQAKLVNQAAFTPSSTNVLYSLDQPAEGRLDYVGAERQPSLSLQQAIKKQKGMA